MAEGERVNPETPVLVTDPRICRIRIVDAGERLSDLRDHSDLLVDTRKWGENEVLVYVREGVAERLIAAQANLPYGIRLVVVEGLRSLVLQSRYFARYCLGLRTGHPSWSEARVRQEAGKYVKGRCRRIKRVARPFEEATAVLHVIGAVVAVRDRRGPSAADAEQMQAFMMARQARADRLP